MPAATTGAIADLLQVTLKLNGTATEWHGLASIRIHEGISACPELRIVNAIEQTALGGDDLAGYITANMDKVLAIDVEAASGSSVNLFTGIVTRVGTMFASGGDFSGQLQTNHDDWHELQSFGTFRESDSSKTSTPEFFWSGGAIPESSMVVGGGHGFLEKMKHNRRSRILEQRTYRDAINHIVSGHGGTVSGATGPEAPIKCLVQYQESDYNFLQRLLKEAGLVFTCLEDKKLNLLKRCESTSEVTIETDSILSWTAVKSRKHELESNVVANDPSTATEVVKTFTGSDLRSALGSSGAVQGKFYETVPEVGDRFSDALLTQFAEQASGIGNSYSGLSLVKFRCAGIILRPGTKLNLPEVGGVHVQTVEHVIEAGNYYCTATAVIAGLPYYVHEEPHLPRIYGPQTAVVTNMVEPDDNKTEHLRVRVKFNWGDGETSLESAWVRVAQPWAGNGHGAQFIPHVGDEVVVEFLNGDPNFPIVTGSVYNGTNKAFYPTVTDGKYTVTAIKTLSNEIKIDDVADSELVQITGKKTFQVIAGAEKAELKADDTQILVQHKEKPISILANQGDITVKATTGKIMIEAGTSITLKVGQNTIEIATGGIKINGTQVAIDGQGGTEVKSSAIVKVQGSLVQIN